MSNINKYIIWERPCYPAIAYIAAEACVLPQIKNFGKPWAKETVCFFEKGMIIALWPKKELVQNGVYVVNNFLRQDYLKNKMDYYYSLENKLKWVWGEIDEISFKKLNNKELLKLFKKYNQKFLDWWGFSQVAELIATGAEYLLDKKEKISKEEMSVLTTPTKKSYTIQEEEDLFKIIDYILSFPKLKKIFLQRKTNKAALLEDRKFIKLLQNHTKKYFWLNNNYAEIKYLKAEYFIKVIQRIIKEGITRKEIKKILNYNRKRLGDFKKKINQLEEKLSFSQRERKIIKLIDFFANFQDKRKALSIKGNYYTYLFLKEIGRRTRVSLTDMFFVLPQEVEKFLDCKFLEIIIKQRKKHFTLIFDTLGLKIYKGDKSIKQERKYLNNNINKVTEFEGRRAMGGKVIGKVRRILKTSEIKKMKKGEILVTTMTSPDFISAVKKARAVVTDEGGVTCHAAIISRELNIPCVIGTKIASRVLKNGDLVEVNANHGVITVIKRN